MGEFIKKYISMIFSSKGPSILDVGQFPRFLTLTRQPSAFHQNAYVGDFYTYSKASRYRASSCTDLDSARF